MYDTFEEWIDKELSSFITGESMVRPLRDLSSEEMLDLWTILKYVSEKVEKRLADLRELLLADAAEFGQDTEKGGQRLMVGRHLVLRERRTSKLPESAPFRALLEDYGIDLEKAYSKRTVTELDPSKIENLINLGKLPEQEVEGLKKVTWALRVKPDQDLEVLLDELAGVPEDEIPEVAPREKRTRAEGGRK